MTKKLRWANAQYDELIRQQAESSQEEDVVRVTRRNRQPFRRRLAKEDERKHLEEYREFLQRQSAERRETLRQQALALQEKEREQQRKEEEKKRKEIEDAAILAYKSQIKEQEEKAERDKKQLEEELEKLLNKVGVEDDKIDQVLKELKPPMTVNHISVESSEGPVEAQPEPHLQNSAVDVVERRSFLARYGQLVIIIIKHITYLTRGQNAWASTTTPG